jgi:dolichol-phosphate mannosyltransferase
MLLSIVIPAYNEEQNISHCLAELRAVLREQQIPYEAIVVNDNSTDGTQRVVTGEMELDPAVRLVNRIPPGGFGRAIRSGLDAVRGDIVIVYMADCSDDANDVVKYYRKIAYEGYDCVFGSRFIKGSKVEKYPRLKLAINRVVNHCIQWMFWTKFNDLTNAFKAYRTEVVNACGPYRASHFNLTLEMSLSALIRQYNIAEIPIGWYGRTWGCSNLRVSEMGRRYLSTLLMVFFQKVLVSDDVIADRLAADTRRRPDIDDLRGRLAALEAAVARKEADTPKAESGAAASWSSH